jgi:hypothetical protein
MYSCMYDFVKIQYLDTVETKLLVDRQIIVLVFSKCGGQVMGEVCSRLYKYSYDRSFTQGYSIYDARRRRSRRSAEYEAQRTKAPRTPERGLLLEPGAAPVAVRGFAGPSQAWLARASDTSGRRSRPARADGSNCRLQTE